MAADNKSTSKLITTFKKCWEFEYFFAMNNNSMAECLVCSAKVICKKFNISRHYETKHKEFVGMVGETRKKVLSNFKEKFASKFVLENPKLYNSKQIKKASLIVSHMIAKNQKPFNEGEFLLKASSAMLECFGEVGQQMAQIIKTVPLSDSTVMRRIRQIDEFVVSNLKERVKACSFFSIALDESTDITDTSQLIICIKIADHNFNSSEEILKLVPMYKNSKGKDIFEAVKKVVDEFGGFSKMASYVTDGAPVMTGTKDGFVGHMIRSGIDVPRFHCIVHQEALCAKSSNITETMSVVSNIINNIRGGHNALKHRKLKQFLKECDAKYEDLKMYTEVRWLSRGDSLKRLFDIREEVKMFLLEEGSEKDIELSDKLTDNFFLMSFAYLTDITGYLNDLNKKLQGKNRNIFYLISNVDGFKDKLVVLQSSLYAGDLQYFECCKQIPGVPKEDFIHFYDHIGQIIDEFNERFLEFDKIRPMMNLFFKPFQCKIDSVPDFLKLEFCDLKNDVLRFSEKEGVEFWKDVSQEKYPRIHEEFLKISSMFGSTWICEYCFSKMKSIKTSSRNRLLDSNLEYSMRIASTDVVIDFDLLADKINGTEVEELTEKDEGNSHQ